MRKNVLLCDLCEEENFAVERVTIATLTGGKMGRDVCQEHYERFQHLVQNAWGREVIRVGERNGPALTQRVLEAMEDESMGYSADDLLPALPDVDPKRVRGALGNLASDGRVERVSRGVYRRKRGPIEVPAASSA